MRAGRLMTAEPSPEAADYDVLMISDLRPPGGTSLSIADETRAQAAAGYRTALLHVNSSLMDGPAGVSEHVRPLIDDGAATLVLPGDGVRARHAIVRDPLVALDAARAGESVSVEEVSFVADHPPVDVTGTQVYDPARVTEALMTAFGHEPTWRPVGPVVRRQLSERAGLDLAAEDWTDIHDVDEQHGYDRHVARLRKLIGAPGGEQVVPERPRRRVERTRVLFVSSNGTGMGHLTRLLAMANRASDRIEPFFFSMSSAVPVVGQYGFGWEYCPSRDDLDVTAKEWNPVFTERFTEIVRRYRPRALVFDGTWPYQGLREAHAQFPDLLYVWSRRAMWRAGHRVDPLEKSDWFDMVIEPGEFAAAADRGPTVSRVDAHRVPPVTLLDRGDLLTREKAREELGMEPDEEAVLVMLGGGNANDLAADLETVAAAVQRRSGLTMYVTRAPIARSGNRLPGDVRTVSVYPLARSLAAFDAAVVACGYNTYHEAIAAEVPTIFVPKAKVTDDQHARARHAEERGVGVALEVVTVDAVDRALTRVLDPPEAARMRARCQELSPDNGAAEAIRLVENMLAQRGVTA